MRLAVVVKLVVVVVVVGTDSIGTVVVVVLVAVVVVVVGVRVCKAAVVMVVDAVDVVLVDVFVIMRVAAALRFFTEPLLDGVHGEREKENDVGTSAGVNEHNNAGDAGGDSTGSAGTNAAGRFVDTLRTEDGRCNAVMCCIVLFVRGKLRNHFLREKKSPRTRCPGQCCCESSAGDLSSFFLFFAALVPSVYMYVLSNMGSKAKEFLPQMKITCFLAR